MSICSADHNLTAIQQISLKLCTHLMHTPITHLHPHHLIYNIIHTAHAYIFILIIINSHSHRWRICQNIKISPHRHTPTTTRSYTNRQLPHLPKRLPILFKISSNRPRSWRNRRPKVLKRKRRLRKERWVKSWGNNGKSSRSWGRPTMVICRRHQEARAA